MWKNGPRPCRRYTLAMSFRERLVATLHAARPVFGVPGVVIVSSQVPDLLEPGAAATLVVSHDARDGNRP